MNNVSKEKGNLILNSIKRDERKGRNRVAKKILKGNITLNEYMTIKDIKEVCYQNGVKLYNIHLVRDGKYQIYDVTMEGTNTQLQRVFHLLT